MLTWRKRLIRIVLPLVFLALAGIALGGCGGGSVDEDSIAAYADAEILVSGLTDSDISVKVSDLAALETVSRAASATRSNGEKVKITAVGPLLDTFLAQYGHMQTDFTRVRFTASDGYVITVDGNVLANRQIILALSDGGKALSAEDEPVRVVIPGERAMYWVRHLSGISFETGETAAGCSRVSFLETAAAMAPAEEYLYNGVADQAARLEDLLLGAGMSLADDTALVFYAADGLKQTEIWLDIRDALLKYTGLDAPRLVGEMPEGMQFYDLVWISGGSAKLCCLGKAVSLWGQDGRIGFYQLMSRLDGVSADHFVFKDSDGNTVAFDADELSDVDLYLREGKVCLSGADGTEYTDIVSAEAAK